MLWEDRSECPDCQGQLTLIKLVDATDRAMSSGIGHVELSYAMPMAAESMLTGTIPVAGSVRGKLCHGCGRIFLFASRNVEGLNV